MYGKSCIALGGVLLASAITHGAATTWSGAVSSDFFDDANWSAGAPGPDDTIVFSGLATTNQPELFSSSHTGSIEFNSPGWTLSGAGTINMKNGANSIVNNAIGGVNNLLTSKLQNNSSGDTITITAGAGSEMVWGTVDRNSLWAFDGSGTIIHSADDESNANPDLTNFSGNLLTTSTGFLNATANASSIGGANSTIGGNGTIRFDDYSITSIFGTLAPGGDGGTTLSNPIGTLFLTSKNNNRSPIEMQASSIVQIDLSPLANDLITTDLNGNAFDFSNATLALRGVATPGDVYTIIQDVDNTSSFSGLTFAGVTFNGITAGPELVTVTYNSDTVQVTVVPEPAMAMSVMGASLLLMRRRRAR